MSMLKKSTGQVAATLAGIGLVLILGCGGDDFVKRYPVSGTITYKGEPVEKGRVTFHPTKPAEQRPASGDIENGKYALTTVSNNDGANPGSYRVTVESIQMDMTKVNANMKGGGPRQKDIASAYSAAKVLIPPKYRLSDTSGLTADVKEQPTNTFDFDLKD
jgi:hypothetical protein